MSSISASLDRLRDLKSSILQFAQDHTVFLIGAILGLVVLYAVHYLTKLDRLINNLVLVEWSHYGPIECQCGCKVQYSTSRAHRHVVS
jgi:hypothetical protein